MTPKLGLANARLSIIDPTPAGHQPMRDPVTNNVLVYNGELYNYRELRGELASCGHHFRTTSDTEVLLKAYAQWGTDCLRRFVGMFAFALWDAADQRLFAARDRLGIKPLYIFHDDDRLMLASEIKAFMPYLRREGKLDLNTQALPFYLTMRCVPNEDTLISDVARLGPGCFIRAGDAGFFEKHAYWRLSDYAVERPSSESHAVDDLRTRLTLAVKRRLVSDVPLGCFLSGGVDSSLVTVLASREYTGGRLHTFSVDFDDPALSERRYFTAVAAQVRSQHHVRAVRAADFLDFLSDWTFFMDDLVSDPSSLPLYFVAKEAHEAGVKVVLSGEGADELFGGYGSYLDVSRSIGWRRPMRMLGLLARTMAGRPDARDDFWRLTSRFPFRGTAYVFSEAERHRYLHDDFPLDPWIASVLASAGALASVNQMLFFDMATRIPSDLLIRTDRATMAASVECRVPFLDHNLVETMLGLDQDLKINSTVSKYVVKKLAEDYLPRELIYRPKVGFMVPVAKWFRNELRPVLEQVFIHERRLGALDYDAIQGMIKEHWSGQRQHEARIWNLLALEMWYRQWFHTDPLT